MTVSGEEEHQPLLHRERYQEDYQSLCDEIEMKESSSNEPWPTEPIYESVLVKNRLVYKWRDIAVTATAKVNDGSSIWRKLRRISKIEVTGADPGKNILKRVSGVAYPGELTAIMGSSGAGKTTLLNSLTFRTKSNAIVTGERTINGYPVCRTTMTNLSGYVQQDDLFLGSLTVREHLLFQAMVRMDEAIPRRQRIRRVDEVLDELGLRKCENTIIRLGTHTSGISGGERKRLSLASEVLTDPPLLFCDEPTSGLDSMMALNVVTVLKSLALKGKTVICTIHQPSSEMYAMFDKIVLLAEGRTAFVGTRKEASNFFMQLGVPCPINYNPADFYIQLLAIIPFREESCRDTITTICDSFEQSTLGLKLSTDTEPKSYQGLLDDSWNVARNSPYKASWTSQFRAVLWRSWLCIIKDPTLVKIRLFQNVVVSILISVLYFQQKMNEDSIYNINGVLFTFLTNMTFQNVFSVMTVFCSERPIFLREHLNGMYRVDVYFLCKTIAEIPIFLALPFIAIAITYYSVGLNPGVAHFVAAVFINILIANVATSFGYLISSVSSSVSMALSLGPPIIIPFLLFGGFLLNVRSIPSYFTWFSYLSWFRYGNEAFLVNQWSSIENIECKSSNSSCPSNGKLVLEMYNFQADRFAIDLISLIILLLLFRFLAFLALLSKTTRR